MYKAVINKFNRGEIDSEALAREDIARVNNSCSYINNFEPKRLGPMQYRRGMEKLDSLVGQSYFIPFVKSADDTALIEFSNNLMRVWVNDALITRTAVTSTISNGNPFVAGLTSWTDISETLTSTAYDGTTVSAKLTGLAGTGTAGMYQTVTTETGKTHGLRIQVLRNTVELRIGTSGSDSFDIFKGELGQGYHSLTFTPSSDFTITLKNSKSQSAYVKSVYVESAGTMSLPTDITTSELLLIRIAQSADLIFMAANGMYKVERRGTESWSIVDYVTNDGPFGIINTSDIRMQTSAAVGGILTATEGYFDTDSELSLFKLITPTQKYSADAIKDAVSTRAIKITGIGTSRDVVINVTITATATVTLQRSINMDDGPWEDVPGESYTITTLARTYNDGLTNTIYYYRLSVKPGDYTSGTVGMVLTSTSGSQTGIGRLYGITAAAPSPTITIYFTDNNYFVPTANSFDWYEGEWSAKNGYPTAVAFHEGRLFWAGNNKLWGSVSDDYYSFDDDITGDSAPISRTIGFGAVQDIYWLAKSSHLIMGSSSDEIQVRSDSYGTPLTQLNTNLKKGTTQGVANIEPVEIDDRIYYVHRSGTKLYELEYNPNSDGQIGNDLTLLNQDICSAGIKRIAVVRQPETRVYVVLNDGTARTLLMDKAESVIAWSRIDTDGTIEDVVILPGAAEDIVYLAVNRTSGRYLEKMSKYSEVQGGTISKHFDGFVQYSSPGTTITGLTHLEGKTVGVWADGQDRGTYTVSSGQITVASSWTDVIVGLPYVADYISNKASNFINESVLTSNKRIVNTGLVLKNYWPGAIQLGPSIARLSGMPGIENGKAVTTTATISDYDEQPFEYDDDTSTDPRIYLRATGPCTILALTYGIKYDARTKPSSSN